MLLCGDEKASSLTNSSGGYTALFTHYLKQHKSHVSLKEKKKSKQIEFSLNEKQSVLLQLNDYVNSLKYIYS